MSLSDAFRILIDAWTGIGLVIIAIGVPVLLALGVAWIYCKLAKCKE
jgi:hypothetical protein